VYVVERRELAVEAERENRGARRFGAVRRPRISAPEEEAVDLVRAVNDVEVAVAEPSARDIARDVFQKHHPLGARRGSPVVVEASKLHLHTSLPPVKREGAGADGMAPDGVYALGSFKWFDVLPRDRVREWHGECVQEGLVGLVESELERLVVDDDDAFDSVRFASMVGSGTLD
jgi:hypothetical protein